jgi:2Fe-2S ferredoxin
MPTISFVNFDGTVITVEAENGSTVMETAINHNIAGIDAKCGGSCSCSTCHVYVDEAWLDNVGPRTHSHEDALDQAVDVRPNSYLSCQIKLSESLDGLVVKPAVQSA